MNKLSIAVVGAGYWGKNLIRNFHELGVLHSICDFNHQVAMGYATQYGVKASTWEEILTDSTIDAVALAVPAAMHADFADQALLANKHVFVEKPISLDVQQARNLCLLAEQKNKVLMVGHLLQYHPAYLKLKALCEEGALGSLQYIYSNRLSLGKVRTEEDVWWSFAPHDISMILGLTKHKPMQVSTSKACYINHNIADVFTAHMQFADGLKAHVFVSWMHPYKEQKLVVIGEKAMAVFDDTKPWEQKLTLYAHELKNVTGVPEFSKKEGECIALNAAEPLQEELKHFIDCVANNLKPLTDGHEATRVLEVLNAAAEKDIPAKDVLSAVADKAVAGKAVAESSVKNTLYAENVFVHHTSEVDKNVTLGAGTKIWHYSHILSNTTIGKNTVIGQNVMIGPDVTVGENCKIQNNVSLYKGIKLGKGVFCGPSCVFTNVNNPRAEIERKNEFRITDVQEGVTIGANATIVCGVTLGKYSFIGAGAVVTKNVPAFALMVGNPARQMGWVSHAGERLGQDLVCPREGRIYQLTNKNQLDEIIHEHSS